MSDLQFITRVKKKPNTWRTARAKTSVSAKDNFDQGKLGPFRIESTILYLGIELKDGLQISEALKI